MSSIAYKGNDSNTTTQTTYTFSSKDLGSAASDRYIIVSVSARKAGTSGSISSITVGGVSATIVAQVSNNATNNSTVGLAIALVPSGATGDIVVTMSEAFLRLGIGWWRADGISSATPHDSGTSTATAPTTNLDLPSQGGFMIGISKISGASTCTWTNITEDFDVNYQAFTSHSAASKEFLSAQTNLAVTSTWAASATPAGAFASWSYTADTTTTKTILGKARIMISTLKTILGKARVTVSTPRTIQGKSRILVTNILSTNLWEVIFSGYSITTKTITGVSRILITTLKTITGLSRVSAAAVKTILGRSRITITTSKTIQGLSRITAPAVKTIQGLARVTISTTRTIAGKARVTVTGVIQTIAGKSRVTAFTLQTILGKSRITIVTNKTIAGISRITKTVQATITGLSRVTVSGVQIILGKSRITIITSKLITGISRIEKTITKTINGISRINIISLYNLLGKSRITAVVVKVITGLSRVTQITLKTVQGLSKILVVTSKNITGKAKIIPPEIYRRPTVLTVSPQLTQMKVVNNSTSLTDKVKSTARELKSTTILKVINFSNFRS